MNELLAKLKAWYGALQQREQRMVAGGALALAVLILVLGVLLPLHIGGHGRRQARRLAARGLRLDAGERRRSAIRQRHDR